MSTLPPRLARTLAEHRLTVIPVVGAGLALAANVPGTWEVAEALRQAGAEEGLVIPADAGFVDACAAFEAALSLEELQDVTAAVVLSREPEPNAALLALVRCPSRIILTANYDFSAEAAVVATGRQPETFWVDEARAWMPPVDGAVHVVHLHGVATEPRTMVFPGESTRALEDDERFKTLLRAVVAPRTELYLGFAFGAAETHLRAELDWLARSFTDAGEHHVLLPAGESARRGPELAELLAKPKVVAHFYDEGVEGHAAVLHAALILAPASPAHAEAVRQTARAHDEYFLAPPLLRSEPAEETAQLDARMVSVELELGAEQYLPPEDMLRAGRVLLDAAPGMGKTEALLVAGERTADWKALYLRLPAVAAHVGAGIDPLTSALRALREAQAFDDATPRPTSANLDSGAYGLLLDGFDEVHPDKRADVLAALEALVDRFPHHAYVVATRPTVDVAPLYDQGFVRCVLVPSEPWGGRYLEHRSVPPGSVAALRDRLPTVGELLAVPVYASAIAERLVRGEEVPRTPLPLLVAVEHDAIRDDAEFFNTPPDELFAYLQRLAVALQLRGLTEAPTEQLAAVTGYGMPEAEGLRRELVERALLQDREGVVAFPSRVMQEALCADAILATHDPVAAVHAVAAVELGGELLLRGDMDHVLDLLWESASPDIRTRLREFDELRYARTQSPDDAAAAQEALDIIWQWYEHRRLWLADDHNSRQVRGAQTAVERLLGADPDNAERRRAALVAASVASGDTTRGNAVTWLAMLPATDEGDTLNWLAPRITDENSVVRRHACVAAEQLRVRAAFPIIAAQLLHDTDEMALETLGHTALALADDDELERLAVDLYSRPQAWRRLSDEVVERVTLGTVLQLLAQPHHDREAWDEMLTAALDKQPPAAWSADEVHALAFALLQHAREGDIYSHLERLTELVERHPEAALRGAEAGAANTDGLLSVDFVFLEGVPSELLRDASNGPLGPLLAPFVARAGNTAGTAPETPSADSSSVPRPRPRARARTTGPATDPDRMPLAEALEGGHYTAERPPGRRQRWPVDALSDAQRASLAELVEAWWPPRPLREVIEATETGWNLNQGALSVVLAAAALDAPLSVERWNDVFASGALTWPGGGVAEWLRRRYVDECAAGTHEVIPGIRDSRHLYTASEALGSVDDATALALVSQLHCASDPAYLYELLSRLVQEGHLSMVQELLGSETDQARLDVVRRVLARHGDVDAQMLLLDTLLEQAHTGVPLDASLLDWHAAARDEQLVGSLGALLEHLSDAPDPLESVQRAARMALAATRSERALGIYDQLAGDPDRPARAFQWYPRAELAADLATEAVLNSLPSTPVEALDVLRRLGFDR